MFDAIGQLFQGMIDFLQPILIPDWRALIDLLPIFLLLGVVGPIAQPARARLVRLRRRQAALAHPVPAARAAARAARRGPAGLPTGRAVLRVRPARLPVRARPAARRAVATSPSSARSAAPAAPALVDTCGTCGLVLKIDRGVPALRPAGPPPGGAAAA